MSDLDPLINPEISLPDLQDPAVTRVVHRHDDPDDVQALGAISRASCSFLLLDGASNAVRYAQDTGWFNEAQSRREFVIVTSDDDRGSVTTSLRAELHGTGVTFQVCDRAMGGRASVLADAVEVAANEFIVMGFGVGSPLHRIPNLLGHMWVEGADIGVVEEPQLAGGMVSVHQIPDAARHLTDCLGLTGSVPEGGVVVMRRWVARWLFNEIARSIDPADEIADRARLLGVAIVHLT